MFFTSLFRKSVVAAGTSQSGKFAGVLADAFMPIRMDEQEARCNFAEPLGKHLRSAALGQMRGFRLRVGKSGEPVGVELHFVLESQHPRGLQSVANLLEDLGAPVGSTVQFTEIGRKHLFGRTEGVALYIDGDTERYDDLLRVCSRALDGAARYQGTSVANGRRALYFYGENHNRVQATLSRVVSKDPRQRRAHAERVA